MEVLAEVATCSPIDRHLSSERSITLTTSSLRHGTRLLITATQGGLHCAFKTCVGGKGSQSVKHAAYIYMHKYGLSGVTQLVGAMIIVWVFVVEVVVVR